MAIYSFFDHVKSFVCIAQILLFCKYFLNNAAIGRKNLLMVYITPREKACEAIAEEEPYEVESIL